jgi:hypothetical protein
VRKRERPTVSKTRARAPTAKVSRGRFSVAIWETNCREKVVRTITCVALENSIEYSVSVNLQKEQRRRKG